VKERLRLVVGEDSAGARLDVFVAGEAALTRSSAATLIKSGHILVNGSCAKVSSRLTGGDVVEGEIVRDQALSAEPEAIPLNIVYQDADLVIIDKPAGMVVHPAAGHRFGTLANALMARFPAAASVGPADRPGIVHRLDKDTSGLMVVALNDDARLHLQRQIAARTAGRHYLALATGEVEPTQGLIDAPIGRDPDNRKRMWVYGISARPARTRYQVLEKLPGFTFLEARLETGRTHQIRVHLAATGHPLAGDSLYHGGRIAGLTRQFLHATELHLLSPSSSEQLMFQSPLPPDLEAAVDSLRARRC
jgi:23S rRNA pseudouridine1911/1915/1917 synthase